MANKDNICNLCGERYRGRIDYHDIKMKHKENPEITKTYFSGYESLFTYDPESSARYELIHILSNGAIP